MKKYLRHAKNLIKRYTDKINFFYKKNKHAFKPSWEYQKNIIMPYIKPSDIVLDIGSGNYPVPRANILADFFPDVNLHRSGNIIEDKPLVVCSVERLPFKNKSIDFVICSHILEHVVSPIRAALELSSMAKAGYIETPAYGKDILIGSGYLHKWQVVQFDGTFYFFEYSQRQYEANTASPIMSLWMQKKYHPWQDFFWESQDLFNAWVVWHDILNIVEYRYKDSPTHYLEDWKPVSEELLLKQKPMLTRTEIELLENCIATPDLKEPMFFKENRFEDLSGKYFYPVRGKRIYCELPDK